jgi:hypothetical protein
MQDVWFVLEDGRTVDPCEVAPDEAGVLRHASGVAVAMRSPGVPRSRGVDAAAERAKAEANADPDGKAKGKGKAMKPDDKDPAYKTRESKAD